ncbi:serine hydrolase domain-containing protein [Spirilliplanes yamanashiensis]|uniref:Serine hydrolase n=1 Tax=Spirilliplanes yamanashiensis TaxID=42233 RepID=A0A8J3Y7T1_9ACTN|nr:serine hydrolase domain-containing protein [Spirilliplanes yamanashiensis]MDP9817252.1 CubicO group peptidase (beta-lactamase class C family) [Spirilliplanes yamanashiensis]GIJ03095.1 serine hydrolase [Spirilliplanes yamanashiensis]
MDERFAGVAEVFAENLASGADVGASFCVTVDGETVVDLWGGFADEARTRPWRADTVVGVYSTTKTMTALTALLVADRGELDFAAPVARYWPEFAAGGKERVTVAQLMSHSAGLCGWRAPITRDDLYDWDKVTALLAAQEPFWEPGTASGYHAMTQGYLVGEVVRRITGRSLGTVFREEIAAPLGADFFIGLPAAQDARVAELIAPDGPPPMGGPGVSELQATVAGNPELDVQVTRTRAWRGAEIPAVGGIGNARAVAGIHAILANGGVARGRRFLSEAGCRRALEPQVGGVDLVLGVPVRFGLGFALDTGFMPHPDTLFWGGYGGSLAIVDMTARTTIAYAMNRMSGTTTGDDRAFGLAMAFWAASAA